MDMSTPTTERKPATAAEVLPLLNRPRRLVPTEVDIAWLGAARRGTALHKGHRLALWHWGEGPRVLLVHGWDSHAAHLAALGRYLLAAGLAVVAFDNPAHGQSEGDRTNVVDIGQAVLSVVKAIGPVDGVLAHSVGSPAALYAFAQGLEVRASVHIAGPASLLRVMQGFAAAAGLSRREFAALQEGMEAEIGGPLAQMELPSLRHGFRHPALLLHDPADPEIPFAESEALHHAWPGSMLMALPDVGHRRILISPAANTAATKFLQEALGRAGAAGG